jgi:hypothetical protein
MDSRIVRVATVAAMCVLIAAVGVPSFAGSAPNVTSEDHMDPQNPRDLGRADSNTGVTVNFGWGVVAPLSRVDTSSSRYVGGTSLLKADLERIVPGASLTPPSALPSGYRILAVHLGAQTVYVTFKSEEEKKQYLADLMRDLTETGHAVKPFAQEADTSPKP